MYPNNDHTNILNSYKPKITSCVGQFHKKNGIAGGSKYLLRDKLLFLTPSATPLTNSHLALIIQIQLPNTTNVDDRSCSK
jgi:hypothetical protein